jgi:hypothetical protein
MTGNTSIIFFGTVAQLLATLIYSYNWVFNRDLLCTQMLRAHHDDILTIVMIPFRTIVGQIIHINIEKPAGQNNILVTTLVASTQAEIDLHALEWRLPVSVDASDTPGRKLSRSLFEEASHELY